MKTKALIIFLLLITSFFTTYGQLGKCKGKYFGNIIAYSTPSNYSSLWNQVTSENGSKWGSCDRGNGVYNFGNSDLSYNWAKNNDGLFKFHALIWGAQAPGYLKDADANTIETAIRNWFQAVDDHYGPMGGLKLIDVLNEPVNTPINREVANLKAALTQGYKSEAANQGDLNNPYGWAIWPFQLARQHFPDALLLINEFNVEHNWNNCRAEYIKMSNAIKNAPNLTDGKKNIIDGVGLQAHGIETLSASAWEACINEIWNSTNLPVHITELDIVADPNEELQRSQFEKFVTIAWEHEHVAGITLWGYIQGQTWRGGNKVNGPSGTDSGIQYSTDYAPNPLGDRPAMTWIKQYMASQASLSCCPDPYPFANCINGVAPTVSFTSPTELSFVAPATVTFDVLAEDSDGDLSNINFYLNGDATAIHEEWVAPYSWDMDFTEPGTYQMEAIAYDANNNTANDIITIKVNEPQGPFSGTALSIPGKIEFEDFDKGGNGFAYYDTSEGNDATGNYRTDEDVDIEDCDEGGYNIGWTYSGEWLEYTVDVQETGSYDIVLRASTDGDKTLSMSSDGVDIATDVLIGDTQGWQNWTDVVIENVELTAGEHVIRVTIGATDFINLNYMTFTKVTTPIEPFQLKAGWNLIGCPLDGSTDIDVALASIWQYVELVKNMDGFYKMNQPAPFNSLLQLEWGMGYLVFVSQDCELTWE